MSVQSANDFARASATDPALLAEVASATHGKTPSDAAQAVSELAHAKHFDFTPEEGMQARAAFMQSHALSDADLNSIAGGGGDPMIDGAITAGTTAIAGRLLPVGAGNVVGAGAGAAISTAVQGGSASDSLAAGAQASAQASNDLGQAIRNFFSGW